MITYREHARIRAAAAFDDVNKIVGRLEDQDRATHLAVYVDGVMWAAHVPTSDRYGEATRQTVAAQRGLHPERLAILKACNDHPETPAVDCLICAPED